MTPRWAAPGAPPETPRACPPPAGRAKPGAELGPGFGAEPAAELAELAALPPPRTEPPVASRPTTNERLSSAAATAIAALQGRRLRFDGGLSARRLSRSATRTSWVSKRRRISNSVSTYSTSVARLSPALLQNQRDPAKAAAHALPRGRLRAPEAFRDLRVTQSVNHPKLEGIPLLLRERSDRLDQCLPDRREIDQLLDPFVVIRGKLLTVDPDLAARHR